MCDSHSSVFPSARGETMKRFFGFFLRIIGILSLVFLLTSCVIGRYYDGSKIREGKIIEIKPGVTTRAEIVSWFGPPQNYVTPAVFNEILRQMDLLYEEPISNYPFANIVSYQFMRGNLRGIITILFNFLEWDVKSDHLVIFFDQDEKVKYYGFHKGTDELQ
jgi:hypothetical protein